MGYRSLVRWPKMNRLVELYLLKDIENCIIKNEILCSSPGKVYWNIKTKPKCCFANWDPTLHPDARLKLAHIYSSMYYINENKKLEQLISFSLIKLILEFMMQFQLFNWKRSVLPCDVWQDVFETVCIYIFRGFGSRIP